MFNDITNPTDTSLYSIGLPDYYIQDFRKILLLFLKLNIYIYLQYITAITNCIYRSICRISY